MVLLAVIISSNPRFAPIRLSWIDIVFILAFVRCLLAMVRIKLLFFLAKERFGSLVDVTTLRQIPDGVLCSVIFELITCSSQGNVCGLLNDQFNWGKLIEKTT